MTTRSRKPSVPRPGAGRGAADPLDACSDEELLTRFRDGLQEAFAALVRRYEHELYGYLRRYLRHGPLAEDVFQNTFLQLYLKSDQYEPGRPVRPWLYTIATHQAIDALRRNSRHPALSLDQARDEVPGGDLCTLMELIAGRDHDPLARAQSEECRQHIRASVDRLPEVHRQVLLLAYFEGLKYREIAAALGIPVGTVKSRLHTAMLNLQKLWRQSPGLYEP